MVMNRKETLKELGAAAYNMQVKSAGILSAQEVSELLGIPISEVALRLRTGSLLAVQVDEGRAFPSWQFNKNRVVEHFPEIMLMLDTSSVGVFRFFQTYDEDLACTPIEALKSGEHKQFGIVKILAQQFNKQVAR